jgi:uncharacterized peroxidase-related enzyme
VTHHAEGLRKITKDESLVRDLLSDYTQARIDPKDRALLDYAVKLTREPWNMRKADIDRLRDAGWSDAAILDLNLVSSYYAFVNRLADGLGVQLDARWDAPASG